MFTVDTVKEAIKASPLKRRKFDINVVDGAIRIEHKPSCLIWHVGDHYVTLEIYVKCGSQTVFATNEYRCLDVNDLIHTMRSSFE